MNHAEFPEHLSSRPPTDRAHGAPTAPSDERSAISDLCRRVSVEMTVHDVAKLPECVSLLPPGTPVYVSHLPNQQWQATIDTASALRTSGLEPVPHIPVRKLASQHELEQLLGQLSARAQVRQVLLIAGDVKEAHGPFPSTLEVIESGLLGKHGITRLSVAGHPEGNAAISENELRSTEERKGQLARQLHLELTFVTQFSFESEPIVAWAGQMRVRDIFGKIDIGLAGPARLTTLLSYGLRCGVGPSIRALGARGGAFTKLIGERGPEKVVRQLARATLSGELVIDGIHLYSFGGLIRTCRWVRAVHDGRFELDAESGFDVTLPG